MNTPDYSKICASFSSTPLLPEKGFRRTVTRCSVKATGPPPKSRAVRFPGGLLKSEGLGWYSGVPGLGLRGSTYAFPPETRRQVSWALHRAAGSPGFLDAMLAGIPREKLTVKYMTELRAAWRSFKNWKRNMQRKRRELICLKFLNGMRSQKESASAKERERERMNVGDSVLSSAADVGPTGDGELQVVPFIPSASLELVDASLTRMSGADWCANIPRLGRRCWRCSKAIRTGISRTSTGIGR